MLVNRVVQLKYTPQIVLNLTTGMCTFFLAFFNFCFDIIWYFWKGFSGKIVGVVLVYIAELDVYVGGWFQKLFYV